MFRNFLLFLLLATGIPVLAQNTVTIKGKLVDKAMKKPLEAATIYLQSAKDSSMIEYTISDRNGAFTLNVRKTDSPVILKASMMTYADYEKRFEKIGESIDVGTIEVEDAPRNLDEVVIKNEAPPVRIKNDTLEFNASSFKVRPDSTVEALLKQLPGVEIDNEGKITVNGKEVNQILVNGKPFFDKDGKVALQNLPSDIINKVQITDTKTKKEEVTGTAASSNNASINLTIDEDKNKGFFGKVMGGYGSDKRYESSLMLNYFKDKRKISILGSSNNINATGFSMNEIFDSMGGGRNYSIWTNDDGSFAINGMMFGGGNGIKKSDILGINYGDEPFKDFTTNTSYFYTGTDRENVNRTRQETFLEDGSFITESGSRVEEKTFAHNANAEIEYKIDSLTTISWAPKLSRGKTRYKSNGFQNRTENGRLSQESVFENHTESDNTNVSHAIFIGREFRKKGRYLSSWSEIENNTSQGDARSISDNTFYEDLDGDGVTDNTITDNRNQLKRTRTATDNLYSEIEYSEPLRDSLTLKLKMAYNRQSQVDSQSTFDFDGTSYDILVPERSNYLRAETENLNPRVGLGVQRKKMHMNLELGTAIYNFGADGTYIGTKYTERRHDFFPSANLWGGYNFTKSKNMWVNYSFNVDYPRASQILEIEDVSNPLTTYIGNSALDPNKSHYLYLNFRDYDYATKSGWSTYAGGNFYESRVVNFTSYTTAFKEIVSYRNVSGGFNSWMGGNWSKTIKKEAHSFRFGFGLNANYNYDLGYVTSPPVSGQPIPEPTLYEARTVRLTPRANFNYDYGELLSVSPNYSVTFTDTKYDNFVTDSQSNVTHKFTLQTTSYWPKNVVFGNDFSYTYNSNIADGFRKDFFLWNVSLGYNFLNKDLLAKVKVYDLLDQNLNNTRSITATGIRDEMNTVLRRYVMFSLTYKLEKFGGKKKPERQIFMN